MSGETLLKATPKRTPAAPPRAEERKNDHAITRSTSTPRMRAARGDSATARICRPSRVARSTVVSAAIRATETAMMVSCSAETVAPRKLSGLSGNVPCGKRCTSGPQICSAIASRMVAAASELMRPEMFESLRPRSGRNATRSSPMPIRPAARSETGSAIARGMFPSATKASATKALSVNTAWWARFKMSSTPNTSAYPTANSA